jgi:16S rRNA (cytosine1402-N4)-methyltransferase
MTDEARFEHRPVLLAECIGNLNIKPNGSYFDGTVGGAGHAVEIAKRLTEGMLYATDKDEDAIQAAAKRLSPFDHVVLARGNYKDAGYLLGLANDSLDGALLDLGVSSYQLDHAERGFSYQKEGALDMRMDREGQSAADIVNEWAWQQLADTIRRYGEEPYAAAIAKKIVAERQKKPIQTTLELGEIITSALPPAVRRKSKNPARKTFQALRIAVNNELEALEEGLCNIFELLKPGGRFCVITFHSLEDRIVKQYFASLQTGCTCPPDFPICVCGNRPKARAITRKPIVATPQEQQSNRRARSAKLRVIEKQ